jgi:hypothetical protein
MPHIEEDRIINFGYDIQQWINNGYQDIPERKEVSYRFSLTADKKHTLDILLDQYKHKNINVTLRKMSEHINFSDLYYDVEKI